MSTFNEEPFKRTMTIQEQHQALVSTSFKHIDGRGGKMELLHAILGLAGEVGELVDAVKKHVFYEKDLDVGNVVEELGDIEYYLEAFRQNMSAGPGITFGSGWSREAMLQANLIKLRKRYPGEVFSNEKAVERADKVVQPVRSFMDIKGAHMDTANDIITVTWRDNTTSTLTRAEYDRLYK